MDLEFKKIRSFSPLQEREKKILKREPLLRIANLQEMLGTSCEHLKLLNENEKKIVKSRKNGIRLAEKKKNQSL